MTQLSQDFELHEFLISQEAARSGLKNVPGKAEIDNLKRLCKEVLQPLRSYLKRPVIVTSGYRAPAVNRAVRGSSTSAHMYGLAADIFVPGMTVRQLMHTIKGLKLPFDQMIDEYGSWVHVGLSGRGNRGEILEARFVNGKAVYRGIKL